MELTHLGQALRRDNLVPHIQIEKTDVHGVPPTAAMLGEKWLWSRAVALAGQPMREASSIAGWFRQALPTAQASVATSG